jgi:hypothetical protein
MAATYPSGTAPSYTTPWDTIGTDIKIRKALTGMPQNADPHVSA